MAKNKERLDEVQLARLFVDFATSNESKPNSIIIKVKKRSKAKTQKRKSKKKK
jgi:hypothetical protein